MLSAHWLIYRTFIVLWGEVSPGVLMAMRVGLLVLAFSFVAAALLSYYRNNAPIRVFYTAASAWLGFLNYFFFAAVLSWLVWLGFLLPAPHIVTVDTQRMIVAVLFSAAAATGIYGVINARLVRIRRLSVHLANLPAQWRGRSALIMSDLHLGHVNGVRFSQRMTALAKHLDPDIIFIPGDVFDGTKADALRLAEPFRELKPRFGVYFATGNHDEFGDRERFLAALQRVGVRVLSNETVIVDGIQIIGVPYHDTTYPLRLRTNLQALGIQKGMPSILLNHVPNRLPIVEEAGVSLQLSGHTHGGQIAPFTWLTQRVFGKFTHGLHAFGSLQVLTSYGAGTWGPPMRVGTVPEVVLLRFE